MLGARRQVSHKKNDIVRVSMLITWSNATEETLYHVKLTFYFLH